MFAFESFVKSISYKTTTCVFTADSPFESFVKSISYKTNSELTTLDAGLRALLNQ